MNDVNVHHIVDPLTVGPCVADPVVRAPGLGPPVPGHRAVWSGPRLALRHQPPTLAPAAPHDLQEQHGGSDSG